jgi:DNA-binding transcriptional MerR regulator
MMRPQTSQRPAAQEKPSSDLGRLTIGQVARMVALSAKAIRYYEAIGLLPRAARGANRYRSYGLADVNRLILLRRIRLLGVPLHAARSLLAGAADARCTDVRAELLELVDERLRTLDREIAELGRLRDGVERYSRALADCHPGEAELFRSCLDMRCIADAADEGGLSKCQESYDGDDCCL